MGATPANGAVVFVVGSGLRQGVVVGVCKSDECVLELRWPGVVYGPVEGRFWWEVLVAAGVACCCGGLAVSGSHIGCCGAFEPVGSGVSPSCKLSWRCVLMWICRQ